MPFENAGNGNASAPPPSNFPNYPAGVPVADPKFHSPLYKMMRSMMGLKGKGKTAGRGKKGLAANQSIHITRKKKTN